MMMMMMMMTEMDIETSVYYIHLTQLIAREDFIMKLYYYVIQGTVTTWFRSYLTNRKQRTEIRSLEKFSSEWGTVKHGVPEGSILWPLLFFLYINDLLPTVNTLSEPIFFTDDTS
jgi:hypothetical protein